MRVQNVVSRWAGSVHDQTVFMNSAVQAELEAGAHDPFIIIADSGYRNTTYLCTPFTANLRASLTPGAMAYQRSIIIYS